MKRILLSAAAVLLVILMATVCLTACGGSSNNSSASSDSAAANDNATLTEKDGAIGGALEDGTYKMTALYIDGKESNKLMSALQDAGDETDINTGLIVNGIKVMVMEVEYTLKDGKLVGDEDTAEYAVNGSVVTILDSDGSKMVFEKQ